MRLDAPRSLAAALVADAARLGPVRVVLRGCGGCAEAFCRASALRLEDGWLHVQEPAVHVHVPIAALSGATLYDAGSEAHPHRPSLWLHGRSGAPVLILVLDQTAGEEWVQQEAAFHALRARWGARVPFGPDDAEPAARVLH